MLVKTSHCDVLIIGAGPAGMMLALWMARMGVDVRIVDKRTDKIFSGQADGFQARTLEILDSFGVGENVWKEGSRIYEVSFWHPGANDTLERSHKASDMATGISRFYECILHQGRLEQFLDDAITVSSASPADAVRIERCVMPTKLTIDESAVSDDTTYPVTVKLRHLTQDEATPTQMLSNLKDGMFRSNLTGDDTQTLLDKSRHSVREEVLHAKYVVGCDGAHSWTRKTLGDEYNMVGESTDYVWGVMDIIPITDFPDIRNRCVIYSKDSGTIMVIPRENKLVRMYIQLNEISVTAKNGSRVDRSRITPEVIISAAKKIIAPFTLDYHYCDWWTAYQIGQRVGNRFSKLDRVFLAGDAVHTHSPKAGQGMNVSMQDTYNLGWKLGLVCKNLAPRSILATYESERRANAKNLIDFDHKFSKMFTKRPATDDSDKTGVSTADLAQAFKEGYLFTSGIGINYDPSCITHATEGDIATNCIPGSRMPSVIVHSQWDARPWELHHRMPSDGRFRVLVFGGPLSPGSAALARTNALGAFARDTLQAKYGQLTLSAAPDAQTNGVRFVDSVARVSILDVVLVHSGDRHALQPLRDVHEVYRPFDDKLGWDYDHIFVDGVNVVNGVHEKAYEGLGIGENGAVVVVRPDGYIGLVTDLEKSSYAKLEAYFDAILIH